MIRRCRLCGALHGPPLCRRPSASHRGYGVDWRAVRQDHLALEPRCRTCGRQAVHVDHIVPLARGGLTEPGNLQSLCRACHAGKTAADGRKPATRIL